MLSISDNTYTIINILGKGEYGVVYKVKDQNGFFFALKQYINEGNGIPLGALREISILKILEKLHPYPKNLIKLRDIIISTDFIGIVIPFYQTTLSHAIATNILSLKQKNNIFFGILIGLMWLRTCDILHRDIKPDNIMLDDQMNPIIIDFSLSNNTVNTGNICSFVYRPPEIFKNKPYNFSIDMWSFGVMMIEMYTKKFLNFNSQIEIFNYLKKIKNKIINNSYFFLIKNILIDDPTQRLTSFQCINLIKPSYIFPSIPKIFPENCIVSNQIKNICEDFQTCENKTPIAAQIYSNLVDNSYTQIAVILAAKFYEKEILEIDDNNFYKEELEIFIKRNYQLFI